jgi:tyrosyl-tRNA synthetase
MPTETLSAEDFTDGVIDVVTLVHKAGLVTSKSDGRRAVEQGGVTVDGEKVGDIKQTFTMEQFAGEGLVVKRGKKSFRRVVVE